MSRAITLIFQMVADAIMFLMAVIFLVTFLAQGGLGSNQKVREEISLNETIKHVQQDIPAYDGYFRNGEVQYDGIISGKQVFSDITNGTDKNIIVQAGVTTRLDNEYVHDSYGNNVSILTYSRESDASILWNYVRADYNYMREYYFDGGGNRTYTVYVKQ